ncbi:MAG: hypothetical protein KQH63_19365 [Desulfobulbaceae bacterium]|nr:hypothetical protein [Desulfobulbaceae bacterium]
MNENDYVVKKSTLEQAGESRDDEWLMTVYEKGVEAFNKNSMVLIEREFSDASKEIVKTLNDAEQLKQYLKNYSSHPFFE